MKQVIDKIFDVYLLQHYHYLIQMKDGSYITRNNRDNPLHLYHVQGHLNGKQPIGTFAGRYLTKFICFDVDFREPDVAKWVTYKITHTLDTYELSHYAVSYSGSKGYHIELYFDKAISLDASRQLFELIVHKSDLLAVNGGEVEFRPSATQGVKLPLGVNQKTGNYCGFCAVDEGLRVMDHAESAAHFLTLKKTDHAAVLAIIAAEHAYDSRAAGDMENAISRHKPLIIYDQSESYTLRYAGERYYTGLTGPGQRHKSFLLLARLMNHNGVERTAAIETITEWFTWQDKRFYTSSGEECARDLSECVDYVYDANLTLIIEHRDLTVTFSEVDAIIRTCSQKNQKALTYAMLIHSKRMAGQSGVFYMTYKQMEEAVGIGEKTARRQINQLERLGVVEIVSRNQKQQGTHKKKPNFYRMTLNSEPAEGERFFNVTDNFEFGESLRYFYTEKELRTLLPRRQSEAVLGSLRPS